MTAISLLIIAAILGCAAVGTPDGGPYDETPPRLLGSTPIFGAKEVKNKKITLNFDEYIKINNASEKVVVSPPQLEQPEIKVNGMKIQVILFDSLRSNTTYTIDFSDAIVDNNEGNPLGDFCYSFSTGPILDTMQVSGYVLEASDLEPIKGILVGLYSDLSDSAFVTKPFEKVTHTDADGHFIIKGLAPGKYKVYALQDFDQNYYFSQRSEKLAWMDSIIITSSDLRYRDDTIKKMDGTVDSIKLVQYTKYYPDDIILRAFTPKPIFQYLVKSERSSHEKFNLQFALPLDSMPKIKGINFDEQDAYIYMHSIGYDTIQFWMKDSNVYYMDTLCFSMTYLATDTNGVLSEKVDTLSLTTKKTHQRILQETAKKLAEDSKNREKERRRLEKDKDTLALIEFDKPKINYLNMELQAMSTMDLNSNVHLVFKEPVLFQSDNNIHVQRLEDSVWVEIPYKFEHDSLNILRYTIYAEWRPSETYSISIDSATITGLYGLVNKPIKQEIKFRALDQYSILTVNVKNSTPGDFVQLLDAKGDVVRRGLVENGKADFFFLMPGKYYVRLVRDKNRNGKWDTGDYSEMMPPEEVFYINKEFDLKQNWDYETDDWDVSGTPLNQQKPLKITTQKSEKKKAKKSKNEERNEKLASRKKVSDKKK